MEKQALNKIFKLIHTNEGKAPLKWLIINNIPINDEYIRHNGSLDLSNTKISFLPKGLKIVTNNLYMVESNIISLPDDFEVLQDLDLRDCKDLIALPEGLKVGRDLNLRRCTNLKTLPKGLEVKGDLYISRSGVGDFTDSEILKMIEPGFIKGDIF